VHLWFHLQCVPIIATIPWYSTMLPLMLVLLVRGFKDLTTDVVSLSFLTFSQPILLSYFP